MTTAAAKERRAKKRKAEAALGVKRSIVPRTKWRAEVKMDAHVLLKKRMNTLKTRK